MKRRGCLIAALVATTCAWGGFARPSESDRLQTLGGLAKEPAALQRLLRPDLAGRVI